MRTFDEIKINIKSNRVFIMNDAIKQIEEGNLKDYEEIAASRVIKESRNIIENLDEVTTIQIGYLTNSLINAIQSAYKNHLQDYWQDYEGFLDKYVIGIAEDGTLKNGHYYSQKECLELGINAKDLQCFKGNNPMNKEIVDTFIQNINLWYGTNIPMSGVEEKALKDYESVMFSDDEKEISKRFIYLKEVQRDAGTLKNGITYYLLANNKDYQEAKEKCMTYEKLKKCLKIKKIFCNIK